MHRAGMGVGCARSFWALAGYQPPAWDVSLCLWIPEFVPKFHYRGRSDEILAIDYAPSPAPLTFQEVEGWG